MEALKQLPIGVQEFEKLRLGNYLYVDKTKFVYQLATTGCYYFLSRPRRFGKSMLISTLHAYFEGKKELFEGLAIADLEKEWIKHPVLRLDLNVGEYKTEEDLRNKLSLRLSEWEIEYGASEQEKSLGDRFSGVIRRAAEKMGQRTVILVDEYDKPILQAVDNDELQSEYRSILKGFYGALKTMDAYIRFALLTGVTKFGKVSVFSDLNNLNDISMSKDYVAVCGMTDAELDGVLAPYVESLAKELGKTTSEVREELSKRYDGYHFRANSIAIYNPFSVLLTFNRREFGSYWFETGTPTYLVSLLKRDGFMLEDIEGIEVGEDVLNCIDVAAANSIPVIYQSGYLTIKGYESEFGLYKLGYPNLEVKEGFLRFLVPYYTALNAAQTDYYFMNFVKAVRAGKIDEFMERLQSLFADKSYQLKFDDENNFQNAMVLIFDLIGLRVKGERHTSNGRIDMTLETADAIYAFEFKFDGTAEAALEQINEKDYMLPFRFSGKKPVKIGVNFSSEKRTIDRWLVE